MIGDLEAKYIIRYIISGQTLESCVKNGSRIASTNKEVQNSEWALGRFTTLKAIDTSRLKAIFWFTSVAIYMQIRTHTLEYVHKFYD